MCFKVLDKKGYWYGQCLEGSIEQSSLNVLRSLVNAWYHPLFQIKLLRLDGIASSNF